MRRTTILLAAVAAVLIPLLAATPADASQSATPTLGGINLDHVTVLDLQRDMNQHRLSSVALTGVLPGPDPPAQPGLHAVIETNPDAVRDAVASDATPRPHDARGPLEGIPVLLKDNVGTGDREHTTAGSFALIGAKPADAFLVARCAPPAPSSSARPTCPSGPTSGRSHRPAAGAPAAVRPTTPTCWTATRAVRPVVRPSPPPPIWPPSPSAPRPTAPSSARPAPTTTSASSPPSAWSAATGVVPISARAGHRRPDHAQHDRRGRRALA